MADKLPFPKNLAGSTPATVRAAFNKTNSSLKAFYLMGDKDAEAKLSPILSELIVNAGRFAEHWASDVLYNIDDIRRLCTTVYDVDGPFSEIFTFGIRKSGVDGNGFLISRLKDTMRPMSSYIYPEQTYRKILAVQVAIMPSVNTEPTVEVALADITNSLNSMEDEDLKQKG